MNWGKKCSYKLSWKYILFILEIKWYLVTLRDEGIRFLISEKLHVGLRIIRKYRSWEDFMPLYGEFNNKTRMIFQLMKNVLLFYFKVILKAHTMDTKQVWVKKMRQLIQDTYFGNSGVPASLPTIKMPTNRQHFQGKHSQRSSRYYISVFASIGLTSRKTSCMRKFIEYNSGFFWCKR